MSSAARKHPYQFLAIAASGLGIGWLTGMSASPVVGIVLASILAVATAVITALAGLESMPEGVSRPSTLRPNTWPVAILVIGVVCGALIGIQTRVNEWVGPSPAEIANRWRSAGLNLSADVIAKRLFDREYGSVSSPSDAAEIAKRWRAAGLDLSSDVIVRRIFEREYASASPTPEALRSAESIPAEPKPLVESKPPPIGSRPDKPYLFQTDQKLCETLLAKEDSVLRFEMQHSGRAPIEAFANRVQDPKALKAAVETFICPEQSSRH